MLDEPLITLMNNKSQNVSKLVDLYLNVQNKYIKFYLCGIQDNIDAHLCRQLQL